jgi:DNA polymerase III alpha subunit (gram-positive type)
MMNMGDLPYFAVEKIRPFSVHTLCKMFNSHFRFEDHKLASVCKTLGIELDAHNAKSDCEATLEILKKLLPLSSKEEVYNKEKEILNEELSSTNSKKSRAKKSTSGFL